MGRQELSWLAQWVAQIDPLGVYPEACLYRLAPLGITYDPSLTLLRVATRAYRTPWVNPVGNLRTPSVMTPKQLMEAAARDKLKLDIMPGDHERVILGALLLQDIWCLLRLDEPPQCKRRDMAATYAAALQGGPQ